jgi:hypothetical protein
VALVGQRGVLAAHVQALLDVPETERPTQPKALRAWLRELESSQEALRRLDQMLATVDRLAERAGRAERLADSLAADDLLLLAVIPKSRSAEVRVALQTWKGRTTIDIRCWALIAGSEEMRPTRKGLQLDVKRLPALLDALKQAAQHV